MQLKRDKLCYCRYRSLSHGARTKSQVSNFLARCEALAKVYTHTTFQLAFLFFQMQTKARVCPEVAGNSERKQNAWTEKKKSEYFPMNSPLSQCFCAETQL